MAMSEATLWRAIELSSHATYTEPCTLNHGESVNSGLWTYGLLDRSTGSTESKQPHLLSLGTIAMSEATVPMHLRYSYAVESHLAQPTLDHGESVNSRIQVTPKVISSVEVSEFSIYCERL